MRVVGELARANEMAPVLSILMQTSERVSGTTLPSVVRVRGCFVLKANGAERVVFGRWSSLAKIMSWVIMTAFAPASAGMYSLSFDE